MNYVAYYRVSTKEQGISGLGLESQRESVRKYLESNGGNLLGEFQDVDSGGSDERIELNKAIDLCVKMKATIVSKRLDRIARQLKTTERLQELGVTYIESDSPNDNQLLKDLKLVMAKDELLKISERTKAALAAKKARGETLGNVSNLTNEGRLKGAERMRQKKLNNPNNKRSLALICELHKQGKHLQEICNALEFAGFKTARGKKNWHTSQVHRLIVNC